MFQINNLFVPVSKCCNLFVFYLLVTVSSLKWLIRLWTERYPDASVDPVNVWDDIITSRYEQVCLQIFCNSHKIKKSR